MADGVISPGQTQLSPQPSILGQQEDCVREGIDIPRRNEEPSLAVGNHVRYPTGIAGNYRLAVQLGFDQHHSQPFDISLRIFNGGQHKNIRFGIRRLQRRAVYGAVKGDVGNDTEIRRQVLERASQGPIANDPEVHLHPRASHRYSPEESRDTLSLDKPSHEEEPKRCLRIAGRVADEGSGIEGRPKRYGLDAGLFIELTNFPGRMARDDRHHVG
jgi:hypothetical protein